jgi:hypothetical protein
MLRVADLHALSPTALGAQFQVGGILLGGGLQLYVADSIEGFDMGISAPIIDNELDERLIVSGVFPIAGGRFGYRYPCVLKVELAPSAKGYKCSLKNIVSLAVTYSGKEVLIVPGSGPKQ